MSANFWLLIFACGALLCLNLYLSLGQPGPRRRRQLARRGRTALLQRFGLNRTGLPLA